MIAPWRRVAARRDARALDALIGGERRSAAADPALSALARLNDALTDLAGPVAPNDAQAPARRPRWRPRLLAGAGALALAMSGTGVALAVAGGGPLAPLHHAVVEALGGQAPACPTTEQSRLLDAAAKAIAGGNRPAAVADLSQAGSLIAACPAAQRRWHALDSRLTEHAAPAPSEATVGGGVAPELPRPPASVAPANPMPDKGAPDAQPPEPTEVVPDEPTSTSAGDSGGQESPSPAPATATARPSSPPTETPSTGDGGSSADSPVPTQSPDTGGD